MVRDRGNEEGGPVNPLTPAQRRVRARVAANLRDRMDEVGLDAATLAKKARVSRSQVFNVLGSYSGVGIDLLTAISRVLEVDPHHLLEPR